MTLENLKNWLKEQADMGEGIQLGGINGNAERYIGVYPGKPPAAPHICLGGPQQTTTGELHATLLIHWGKSMVEAQAKADEIYSLFYARAAYEMDDAAVCMADPGGGPIPVGKDARGICEFTINLKIIYKKE